MGTNFPWSTIGCADSNFITSVALHYARGHPRREYLTVGSILNRVVLDRKQKNVFKHVYVISKDYLNFRPQDGGLQIHVFDGTNEATTH